MENKEGQVGGDGLTLSDPLSKLKKWAVGGSMKPGATRLLVRLRRATMRRLGLFFAPTREQTMCATRYHCVTSEFSLPITSCTCRANRNWLPNFVANARQSRTRSLPRSWTRAKSAESRSPRSRQVQEREVWYNMRVESKAE